MTFFRILFLVVCVAPITSAFGAPGDLDPTFNGTGRVVTVVDSIYGPVRAAVLQADGKILVVSRTGDSGDFAILRYLPGGHLDHSFGVAGKVSAAPTTDTIAGLVVQSDGKIVAVGTSWNGDNNDILVARYLSNGTLDSSFGKGGRVVTDMGEGETESFRHVALQSDGRIVIGGTYYRYPENRHYFAVARYIPNGDLDSSFSGDGMATTLVGSTNSCTDMALQADGKIVLVGQGSRPYVVGSNFAVVRYTASGSLDSGFGEGGKVSTAISNDDHYDSAEAVVVQSDGKIVVAGSYYNWASGDSDAALVRYHADGSRDTSFGTGGLATLPAGGAETGAYDLALQKDGKLLAVASLDSGNLDHLALVRFDSAGVHDSGFGSGGMVSLPTVAGRVYESYVTYHSLIIQDDGRPVVVGGTKSGTRFDLCLARFQNSLVPLVRTLPALGVTPGSASLQGSVNALENAGGESANVSFELTSDGLNFSTLSASPAAVGGVNPVSVSATVAGLISGTTYHYRVKAANGAGVADGALRSFIAAVPSDDARMANIELSQGAISPAFDSAILGYTVTVPYAATAITVVPTLVHPDAAVTVNGVTVASGEVSAEITLAVGGNPITVDVTAQDGVTVRTYNLAVTRESPTPGAPDFSLGVDGRLSNRFTDTHDFGYGVAVQSDGKIIVAGYTGGVGKHDFMLARYSATGSPDAAFGDWGKVRTSLAVGNDEGRCVLLQPDGRILVAGVSGDGFAVARYHSDGSLDNSFGSGGKITTLYNNNVVAHAFAMALQNDGKIVVAGAAAFTKWNMAVMRFHADGVLDSSFGSGGKVNTDMGGGSTEDKAHGIVVLNDGRIVIAGYASTYKNKDFALACYLPDGSLDTNFGTGGKVITSFGDAGVGLDIAYGIALQSDGRLVVTGACDQNSNGGWDVATARYHDDGSLDMGFGTGGKVVTPVGNGADYGYSVALQGDGGILVTGSSHNGTNDDVALLRYKTDGGLDNSFGSGGMAASAVGVSGDYGRSVTVQSDGRVVVAGYTYNGDDYDFALLRFSSGAVASEIAVHSAGVALSDGGACAIDGVGVGGQRDVTFSISSIGSLSLADVAVTVSGANADRFTILNHPDKMIAPGQVAAFKLRYSPILLGNDTATLHIKSNDVDESSFDIVLNSSGLSVQPLVLKIEAPNDISPVSALLRGSVEPKNSDLLLWFEYGTTTSYGSFVAATPAAISGSSPAVVSASISGLQQHTKYYFRLRAVGSQGAWGSASLAFTTSNIHPIAFYDSRTVVPGAVVMLDALANDFDPGDALSITSTTPIPVSQGKIARVNGDLQFTAAAGFSGVAFNYAIKDKFGGTSIGEVNLTLGSAELDLSAKNLTAAGGVYDVQVAANGAWSVNEAVAWISTATPSDGLARITVQPNTAKVGRSATITIAGKSHFVTQAGVIAPAISAPSLIPPAIVSGTYNLPIPTTNPPVTYTATNLPPGLTIDQTSGAIVGKPTKPGDYTVLLKAKNAAGAAPTPVEVDITVAPLSEGVIGAFHGYFTGAPMLSGFLSYRFELTTTATGSLSGKLIGAGKTWPFKGALDADPADPDHPQCTLSIPRSGATSLSLVAAFDASADTLTGTISSGVVNGAGQVDAWRQVWKPVIKPATAFKGAHSFYLDPPSDDPGLPQGRGFGSFTVEEKTGALKVTGKLADGNAITTATFLGPQGQVLIHQALYTGKGVSGGVLTVANDNTITGSLAWYKPAPATNSRDILYREGFGPAEYTAIGSLLPVLPPGGILMGLPDTVGNATLTFTSGALSTVEAFSQPLHLRNPSTTGLTNKAQFHAPNPNKVTLPTVTPATGLFSGDFTLPGATTATNRKATFHGQIVEDENGIQGHGFFLLSDPTLPPQTPATTPKQSGPVLLRPTAP